MANTLLLKKSGSTGESPTSGELSHGELAINYADGKLFFKNSGNSVVEFLSSPGTSAGQALFSNGSTITGDSNFFWDNSNKRLGIGTASPSSNVHIKGSNTPVKLIVEQTTSGEQAILSLNTTNRPWGLIADQSPDILSIGEIGASVGNQMHFSNAGNVGIGTSSPDSQLHLHGSTGFRLTDSNQNANEYAEIVYDNGGTTNLYINNDWTNSNALINFQLAGSTKMVVRGDGHVGIGTDSPSRNLHIEGSEPYLRIYDTAASKHFEWWVASGGGVSSLRLSSEASSNTLVVSNNGRVGIGTSSSSEHLHIEGAGAQWVQIESTDNTSSGLKLVRSHTDYADFSIANNGAVFE